MKKKNKLNSNVLLVITIIIVVVTLSLYFFSKRDPKIDNEFQKEGYETEEEEDPFYKRIVTNNTLDDYYNDISQGKDSSYEEYYFSKESNDFIELKLDTRSNVNTTLNISSDLRTKEVNYNYELTYNKSYLIIEGNSNDNYDCNIIKNKNVNEETLNTICNNIMSEISIFLERRKTILSNKKIKDLVNEPLKEYVEVE